MRWASDSGIALPRALIYLVLLIGVVVAAWTVDPYYEQLGKLLGIRAKGPPADAIPQRIAKAKAPPEVVLPPPPPSAWQEHEKSRWQRILSALPPADILIVPFQFAPGKAGLDVSSRMVMTRMLADQVEATVAGVASPDLVARAFGEPRNYSPDELSRMVDAVRPKRAIVAWASHVDGTTMAVSVWTGPPEKITEATVDTAQVRFSDIPISYAQTPEDAFADLAGEIPGKLGMLQRQVPGPRTFRAARAGFPEAPERIGTASSEPITESIWRLQLLGGLYRTYNQREHDRLFERSLAALRQVSPQSDDYRLLRARAYHQLDRRPAAVAALGTAKSAEEHALYAALNGNLPDLEKWTQSIKRPIARALSELDVVWLRTQYTGIEPDQMRVEVKRIAALAPERWRPLLTWHLVTYSSWLLIDGAEMSAELEREFPLSEASGRNLVERVQALPPVTARVMLPLLQADAVLDQRPLEWSSPGAGRLLVTADVLLLIRDFAELGAYRSVAYQSDVQGNYAAAFELIEAFERAGLQDHPWLLVQQAETLRRIDKTSADPKRKEEFRKLLYESGRKLDRWGAGQNDFSVLGRQLECFYHSGRIGGRACPASPYDTDFPPRGIWVSESELLLVGPAKPDIRERYARIVYDHATSDFEAWQFLYDGLRYAGNEAEAEALVQDLDYRFIGSSRRLEALIAHAQERGDQSTERQIYASALQSAPYEWAGYWNMGTFLLREGDPAQAVKQFLAFPGFKHRSIQNTVALSNAAYAAAGELVGRGYWEESLPLLKLAAGYANGSEASLAAEMTLRIFDRDFATAREIALQSVRRYEAPEAVAEAIVLGHLVDEHAATDAAAMATISRINSPAPWAAAMIGQRMSGKSDDEISGWMSEAIKAGSDQTTRNATRAARAVMLLDRPASNYEKLERMFAGPDPLRNLTPEQRARVEAAREKQRIHDEATLAQKSLMYEYAEIKAGQYKLPVARAEKRSSDFFAYIWGDPRGAPTLIPSLAFAMAKTGRSDLAEKLLDDLAGHKMIRRHHFAIPERYMARAVVRALSGRHDEALLLLSRARGALARPGQAIGQQGYLPVQYVYGETLERLYFETNEERYRKLALEWLRAIQKTRPWASWAYAIEVSLTGADSRVETLAALIKLDRHSDRLSRVPAPARAAAESWLQNHDPFGARGGMRRSGSRV
jgi:hypothetical protein